MGYDFRIKKALPSFWVALSIVAFLALTVLPGSDVYGWTGKVVGVKDGDTIEVLHDGRGEVIRLYGIDAPEKGQDFSNRSKQTLSDLVFGKIVEIKPMDTDRYGRTVGMLFLGGKSVSQAMITAGMAWVFERYCKDVVCNQWRAEQDKAKIKKIGLWSHPKPIPPWEFRHRGDVKSKR